MGDEGGGSVLLIKAKLSEIFSKKKQAEKGEGGREEEFGTKEYYFIMFLLVFRHNLLIPFNPSVATQIFNPIAELLIPMGTPSKKANAEIEIYSVTTEAKTRKGSI